MNLEEAMATYNALWNRWSQTAVSGERPEQAEHREKYGQRDNYLCREEVDAAVKDMVLAAAGGCRFDGFSICECERCQVIREIKRRFGEGTKEDTMTTPASDSEAKGG